MWYHVQVPKDEIQMKQELNAQQQPDYHRQVILATCFISSSIFFYSIKISEFTFTKLLISDVCMPVMYIYIYILFLVSASFSLSRGRWTNYPTAPKATAYFNRYIPNFYFFLPLIQLYS